MRIIINGVFRSLGKKDLVIEMQKYFLGKKFSILDKTFFVSDITLENSSLFFHHEDGIEVLHKVKTIEIEKVKQIIRIKTNDHFFFIKFS